MDFLWFVLIGIASGVVAGMGMGGGTLLIPMLTIIMSVSQKIAQGINLVVFVPMAVVVAIIYIKNKLISFKDFFILVIPAVIISILGALVSADMDKHLLKMIFGGFILAIGVFYLANLVVNFVKKQKNNK